MNKQPSRILKRPPEQTVALPRIPSGVLRPLTPSSSDSRSLAERDAVTSPANAKKNQSYSDNFSEGSWDYYRNNFFASMIPEKKEYGSFGLPTVEESPRFGPVKGRDDDKVRRRSSSYSQALILGPIPPPKKEVCEVAILRLPVSSPQPRVRALSNFSVLEEEELMEIRESVKAEVKAEIKAEEVKEQANEYANEQPAVSTSIYTIGNFEVLDGEDLSDGVQEEEVAVEKYEIPVEKVIFAEEPEPKKKYVPRCLQEKPEKNLEAKHGPEAKAEDKPQVYHAPPLTAIHYSDDAPVRPEDNSLGEKRLVELEFVVGDYIQPLEGKLFYVPRQTVKMYCAPYVHAHDTDFMEKETT